MKYTVPDYYKEFQCIAGDCPDTCCAGWQIVIDERAQKKYKDHQGPFGNRLRNSINWEEGCFEQYNKRCAFLNEENLCDIITEAEESLLCRTCRMYPRHIEEFENERELSLSVSCPVVAETLLKKTEKTMFIEKNDEKEEKPYEDFDFFLYSALQDSRQVMIEILQNRDLTIEFRMAKVLAMAHDIQNRILGDHIFDIQNVVSRYMREEADQILELKFKKKFSEKTNQKDTIALIHILEKLEVLNEQWPGFLKDCIETLEEHNVRNAESLTDVQKEQLLVYFIYTYYCGAVYDQEAFAKIKMAICFVLISDALIQASCYKKDEVVRKFSRELEHSDQNLNKMEEMMSTEKAADFEQLMKLIIGE